MVHTARAAQQEARQGNAGHKDLGRGGMHTGRRCAFLYKYIGDRNKRKQIKSSC